MKKIIIYAILLLCIMPYTAYGQKIQKLPEYKIKEKERILKNCPYIFEGISLYCETYLNNADGKMWRSEYVLVTRIFRGQDKIVPGMLEIVRKEKGVIQFHKDRQYAKYDHTQPNIYFCNDISIATPGSDTIKTGNKIKVEVCRGFIVPELGIEQGFYDERFKNKKDVYDFLGKVENIDKAALIGIPDTMKAFRAYYRQGNKLRSDYDQTLRDEREIKGDTLKKKVTLNKPEKVTLKSTTYSNDLNISFENAHQFCDQSTGKSYFEFDIMVQSDADPELADDYLNEISINLKFDANTTFDIKQTDDITNDDITATFNNFWSEYNTSVTVSDDNEIDIDANIELDFPDCTTSGCSNSDAIPSAIPYTKIQLINLIIPIDQQNPSAIITPTISIANYGNWSNWYYYIYDYDPAQFTDLVNGNYTANLFWQPKFTFSFSSVSAGTNDALSTLDIYGTGFGNVCGKIDLTANDGGESQFALDDVDITSWSDELVTVTVPSTNSLINGNTGDPFCAGSGNLTITNGGSLSASQSLTVSTAYSNAIDINTKDKYTDYLTDMGGRNGIKFKLDPNTSASFTSNDISTIKQAMSDWTYAVNPNIQIKLVDASDPDYPAVTNTIGIDNSLTVSMQTQPFVAKDTKQGNYYYSNITIYINKVCSYLSSNFIWDYNHKGGNNDFYQAFIHELGHVFMLEHVNDDDQLMNYQEK